MSELKHWLDEASEADDFERSILRAGLEADPPEAKIDQIWSQLVGTLAAPLGAAPLAATTTSAQTVSAKAAVAGASKAAAVWLAVAKGFLVGLAIYGATTAAGEIASRLSAPQVCALPVAAPVTPPRTTNSGAQPLATPSTPALTANNEDAPSPTRSTQRSSSSSSSSSSSGVSAAARAPLSSAAAPPSVATFDVSEPLSDQRSSQLEAETRALRRARDELRAGKLSDAFATLEASRRQVSAPELYQEREALMIELLSHAGQASAAEQRARAFLSRFPESPHAQQVRRFLRN